MGFLRECANCSSPPPSALHLQALTLVCAHCLFSESFALFSAFLSQLGVEQESGVSDDGEEHLQKLGGYHPPHWVTHSWLHAGIVVVGPHARVWAGGGFAFARVWVAIPRPSPEENNKVFQNKIK